MLGMITGNILMDLLFFGLPIVSIVLFVVSLRSYRKEKRQAWINPNSFSAGKLRGKLIVTVVLGVIAACLTIVVVGFVALLFMVIAFM